MVLAQFNVNKSSLECGVSTIGWNLLRVHASIVQARQRPNRDNTDISSNGGGGGGGGGTELRLEVWLNPIAKRAVKRPLFGARLPVINITVPMPSLGHVPTPKGPGPEQVQNVQFAVVPVLRASGEGEVRFDYVSTTPPAES
jgi:hypothetical protein